MKTLRDFEVFKATPLRNEKGVKIRGIYWYKVENPMGVKS